MILAIFDCRSIAPSATTPGISRLSLFPLHISESACGARTRMASLILDVMALCLRLDPHAGGGGGALVPRPTSLAEWECSACALWSTALAQAALRTLAPTTERDGWDGGTSDRLRTTRDGGLPRPNGASCATVVDPPAPCLHGRLLTNATLGLGADERWLCTADGRSGSLAGRGVAVNGAWAAPGRVTGAGRLACGSSKLWSGGKAEAQRSTFAPASRRRSSRSSCLRASHACSSYCPRGAAQRDVSARRGGAAGCKSAVGASRAVLCELAAEGGRAQGMSFGR